MQVAANASGGWVTPAPERCTIRAMERFGGAHGQDMVLGSGFAVPYNQL
jgi:hypothetical protein